MDLLCIAFDNIIQLAPIIGATIAAFVVVIGWFIISSLNRKNEIAKELRGYKLDLLQSIIDLQIDFEIKNEINEKLYRIVSSKIKTFGSKEEVRILNKMESDKKDFSESFKNSKERLDVICLEDLSNEALKEHNNLSEECTRLLTNLEKDFNKYFSLFFGLIQTNIRKELKLEKLDD